MAKTARMNDDTEMEIAQPLPIGSVGKAASGWWGMQCLIATEAALFAYLLFSYFYLGSQVHGPWVPELPKLKIAVPNTILLLASSFVLHWGETGIRRGKNGRLVASLVVTLLMGIVFMALQGVEWHNKPFRLGDHAYASSYFVTTGFHMMHVAVGLIVLAVLLLAAFGRRFSAERHVPVSIGALYWHFVDIVWLCVFTTFYITPYFSS
ncbi:cytochrome c oxidase subunit III [Novimethylophilus kurashikiensis]|uniref:Cytochrome c oxidase subunit III n=1 Tax=Novimethylophilus kurashikiensis TaxID=1825523 RepID=A0A2R5F2M6_9PROT|nr:cytochrome c oxidase subunit 3 [Novimethylophilus kurashikiensis]GBG12832.1 cytochrome c oxidase subunit III [Novimethylophilus kurashikiensis]